MTADLNITDFVNNTVPVTFDFLQKSTLTGNRKLAQSWIKMFLTEAGSQQYFPETGTSFLADMRERRIRTSANVTESFKVAADSIAAVLRDDALTQELPDTEQLSEAILTNFNIIVEQSLLQLYVTLIPVEGDPITFDIPVSTKG